MRRVTLTKRGERVVGFLYTLLIMGGSMLGLLLLLGIAGMVETAP